MLLSKKLTAIILAVVMVFAMSCMGVFAGATDTTARGYQLINGDVCDLSGNLLIKMHNGFTADGYTLDPNFRVQYPSASDPDESVLRASSSTIFSGTIALKLNTTGEQGKQLGDNFKATSDEPDVFCKYISGNPAGVNFSVFNITRNSLILFVPNVQAGSNTGDIATHNTTRPDDTYRVTASAEGSTGGDGNAYLSVVLR